MKKILLFGILLSLVVVSHSFAAGNLLLSATGSGNALSIKINNVSEKDISAVVLTFETTPNSASAEHETETIPADPVNGILNFTTTQYLNVNPVYVKAEVFYPNSSGVTVSDVSNEVSVTPSNESITVSPLTSTLSSGNIVITGKLDPALNTWLSGSNFTATLQYSADSTTDPTTGVLKNPLAPPLSATMSAASSYAWTIPTNKFTPSTVYYFQETVTTAIKHTTSVGALTSINVGSGVVLGSGSTAVSAALNSQSYTLLAPLPGLTILPDPQVCAQKQAAAAADGSSPPLCSVNDLLNYALKLLIGVSGVVLVLRLMYEGYQYMVTDVPFLKASSKSGFFTALMGLMLALSAYLILNTINPKLVAENVNVQQLTIGVDIVGDGTTPFTYGTKTKGLPTPVSCPQSGGRAQLPSIANSFVGNVIYNQTLRNSLQPNGKVALDCSSYVAQVLSCAGYKIPSVSIGDVNTGTIFGSASAEKINSISSANGVVTVNGKALNVGDLLGWTGSVGHVVMYLGNGQIIDVHGPVGSTSNAQLWPSIDFYQNKYGFKFVYRIPNS